MVFFSRLWQIKANQPQNYQAVSKDLNKNLRTDHFQGT